MRRILAALVMVGLPAFGAAQSVPQAPLPSIGLPLPRIGLPLPQIGLPRGIDTEPGATTAPRSHGIETHRGRTGGRNHIRSNRTVFYFVPTYGLDYSHTAPAPNTAPAFPDRSSRHDRSPLTGTLRLEVQPDRILQLYVDGFFVGSWTDVNGELELEAGPHRIEMRAPGYETASVDVKIA